MANPAEMSPEAKSLSELLRRRAQHQRWVGWGLLGAIALCVLSTGGIVSWAGRALEKEETGVIATEAPTLVDRFQMFETGNTVAVNELKSRLVALIPEPVDTTKYNQRVAELEAILAERTRRSGETHTHYALEDHRIAALVKAQAQVIPLLGAIVARISFVLLGLFFIQVLVGSYRSASRLAASYDAFADALSLHGAGFGDLQSVVLALTPGIDFGGNNAPTREIVDLVTGVLRQQQSPAKKD